MPDFTTINSGATGDDIFSEDVSTDAQAGFPLPVGVAGTPKIQGAKLYVGLRGQLGVPVSDRDPLPAEDTRVASQLEQLNSTFADIRELLDDGVLDMLSARNDHVLVRDGAAIAFGANAATGGSAGGQLVTGLIRVPSATSLGVPVVGYSVIASRSDGGTGNRNVLGIYAMTNDLGVYIGDSSFGIAEIDLAKNGLYLASPGFQHYILLDNTPTVRITALAGVGSRAVFADASGKLSAP